MSKLFPACIYIQVNEYMNISLCPPPPTEGEGDILFFDADPVGVSLVCTTS